MTTAGKRHTSRSMPASIGTHDPVRSTMPHSLWTFEKKFYLISSDSRDMCVDLQLIVTRVLHLNLTRLGEPEYGSRCGGFSSFGLLGLFGGAVLEAIAVVAGLNDVAMMSQPV